MAMITETKVHESHPALGRSTRWPSLPYKEVADLIQPYPEKPQGFGEDYMRSLPSRWSRFAQAFREVSDEAGQYS